MKQLSLVHDVRPAASGANRRAAPPLLVLMHGVGANERQMATVAPAFDHRFVVLCVRSPVELGPDAYGWFHVTFTPDGPVIDATEAEHGWKTVARFIDEAVAQYGADPSRVYVGGFSQGGIMSLAALLTSPERIAGAVCMSGRLLPEVLPHAAPAERLRDKPVLVVHGTQDTKLGVHYARSAREKLEALGLAVDYGEFDMPHTITDQSLRAATEWLTSRLDAEVRV